MDKKLSLIVVKCEVAIIGLWTGVKKGEKISLMRSKMWIATVRVYILT